jgi:hypothetical protein
MAHLPSNPWDPAVPFTGTPPVGSTWPVPDQHEPVGEGYAEISRLANNVADVIRTKVVHVDTAATLDSVNLTRAPYSAPGSLPPQAVLCKKEVETLISTSSSPGAGIGPTGPAGPAGPTGPAGPAGPATSATSVTTSDGSSVQKKLDDINLVLNNLKKFMAPTMLVSYTLSTHDGVYPSNVFSPGTVANYRISGIPIGFAPDCFVSPIGSGYASAYADMWIYRTTHDGTTATIDWYWVCTQAFSLPAPQRHTFAVLMVPPTARVHNVSNKGSALFGSSTRLANLDQFVASSGRSVNIDQGYSPTQIADIWDPSANSGSGGIARFDLSGLGPVPASRTVSIDTRSLRSGSAGAYDGGHAHFTVEADLLTRMPVVP